MCIWHVLTEFILFCRLVYTNEDDTVKMVLQNNQEVLLTTPFPSNAGIPVLHSSVDAIEILHEVPEFVEQVAHTDFLPETFVEGEGEEEEVIHIICVAADSLETGSQTRESEAEGFQCEHLHYEERFLSIIASHYHHSVCQAIQFLPHLPFITPVEVFQVTSAGGVYRDDSLGISITVPEGAVPEFTIFPIEVGTCLYGPFQFPEGSTLIAPILMLCPQKNIPLKKPIIVMLPHILVEATEDIQVVKADHAIFRGSDLEKCVFKDIDQCESHASFDDQNNITFSVSHFCFLSVRAKNSKKKKCCICPLIDRATGVFTYRLCVTYFMKPCIQVRCMFISMSRVNVQYPQAIKEQFPREKYELEPSSIMSFSFDSENSFIEATIKCVDQNKWSVFLNSADSDSGIQVSIHYDYVL